MIEFQNVSAIALAFFIVTASPGPANIAVATVSMGSGRRSGLLFGFGLSLGLVFWGIVAATGLGAILQNTSMALFYLKLCGGAYLLWLACQSARSAISKPGKITPETRSGMWFWRGLMLNLSSPKAVVAWMAALSMGLGADGHLTTVAFATVVCMILGFANYTLHALAFSLPGFMSGYRRLRKWIDGAVAGLFAIAGLGLIRSAFSR